MRGTGTHEPGNVATDSIFLDERNRSQADFESLLRSAASGQRITRVITVKGEAVEFTVKPPIAIIDLALPDRPISRQDRSRYLRMRMPSDSVARDEISRLSVERFTLDGRRRKKLIGDFARAFQIVLAGLSRDIQVTIPFARRVTLDTTSRLRDRLLGNFLNAVSTVAWLRQKKRDRKHDEAVGYYIEANDEDYAVVYDIVCSIGEDGSDGQLRDNALGLLRRWVAWAIAV